MADLFRGAPAECPQGHPWGWGSGNVLLGSTPCTCPAVKAIGGSSHIWIKCLHDDYEWTYPEHGD